jgi:hypothetical protein
MTLDHHNGKAVQAVTPDSITFSDGTVLNDLLSVVPDEIVGTTLLQVRESAGVSFLAFGHSFADGREPVVVATVEAVGADLRAEDAKAD